LNDLVSGLNNLCSLLLSPAWVQTFVMTFLGEWGDRSQIATIAMAAGQDYWWVTIGASAGHGICTAAAVIGGRAIAGRVSMRVGMYQYFPPSLFKDNANNDTYSDSRWCRCIPHFWRHLFHRSHFLERCISAVVCVYGFSFRVFGGWFACKSRLHLCDISLF
jgi:hypothetical protein